MGFPSPLLPHPAFCLRSQMLSYPWLLSIFCLFPLAHSSFPALPPLPPNKDRNYFSQFDRSWKQNNLLLNTHFVLVGKVVNLFERTFSPLLLSSLGINTSFSKYDNYWKWSNHPWMQVILYFKRSNFWQTRPFHFLQHQKKVTYSTHKHHQPFCFPGFSWKNVLNSPAFIWLVWESLLSWRHVLKRLKLQLCCPQKTRICFHSWGQNKGISLNKGIL